MADPALLDAIYDFVLRTVMARGTAPHYTEIASHFALPVEQGRQWLHALMGAPLPNWLFPGTDLIASVAPFNNLPTQYRVTIDGQQKWYAQCGLEALAVGWLFPGRPVQIDAPCLDCGEPLTITVRDGVIERQAPDGIVLYVGLPFREWYGNLPYA
jgi:alkylmercury lyase-like protein